MRLIATAALMLPLAPALATEKPLAATKAAPIRCAVPVTAELHAGPLGSMPNATEIKTLSRTVGGCPAPLVGRTDRGSNRSAGRDRPDLPLTIKPAR